MAAVRNVDGYNVPDGGLGSFLSSNIDEIADNVLAFGRDKGINSMQEVAERMAAKGRGTDSYIVHATEKEIILPKEVGDKNPELVLQIKDAISRDGMDPEAYVVGSEANSINPETGQPEFFKFLKKLVKGLKKAAKVILPVALNFFMPGLGTVASAAIGAGIGGLVQGESLGEAFKSGIKGALVAGAVSGAAGAFKSIGTEQTLAEGFKTGLQGALPASYQGGMNILPKASDFAFRKAGDPMLLGTGQAQNPELKAKILEQQATPSIIRTAGETVAQQEALKEQLAAKYPNMTDAQLTEAVANVSGAAKTNLMKNLALGIPAALSLGAATGAFDPIPAQQIDLTQTLGETGEGLIEETYKDPTQMVADNPELYRAGVATRPDMVTFEDVLTPSRFSQGIYAPQYAAAGGPMTNKFPRRTGQIQGPGTETSDDIPAMLSDGEFVMTAQAVRGAGNGSREEGFRRMYDIMRAFEGGAVA
jgi:hypothetical protein